MTEAEVRSWFATAKPGECLAYHHGVVAVNRSSETTSGVIEAKRLFNAGAVELVQRRIAWDGPFRFAYLAIKRASPSPPPRSEMLPLDGLTVIDDPELAAAA